MADYSIEELEELTGFARRTIRYYIQQELIDAPFGARKTPRYTQQHVEQLLKIRQYKEAGLNLRRIAQLLKTTEAQHSLASPMSTTGNVSLVSRIHLTAGVSIDIDRSQCSLNDDQIRQLASEITTRLNHLQGASHD